MFGRDNKRYGAPDKTFTLAGVGLGAPPPSSFLDGEGGRRGGRQPLQMRPMYLGFGADTRANGSSYIELGETKLLCSVFGPNELPPSSSFKLTGQVVCEVRYAPHATSTRRSPVPDKQTREMSQHLKRAIIPTIILEQYPKSQWEVYVTVVRDAGGVLGAAVTAASLALSDAGVAMVDIAIATSLVWHRGIMYVDPTLEEEEAILSPSPPKGDASKEDAPMEESPEDKYRGSLTVALMPKYGNGQVSHMVQYGNVTVDQLTDGLDQLLIANRTSYATVQKVLLAKHVNQEDEDLER